MAKNVALFGVYDNVTGELESASLFTGSSQAARVLVAMYAFSSNPAVSNRLADYQVVQLTEYFDPIQTTDDIKHIFVVYGSLEKIKSVFDRRDGVFTLPLQNEGNDRVARR